MGREGGAGRGRGHVYLQTHCPTAFVPNLSERPAFAASSSSERRRVLRVRRGKEHSCVGQQPVSVRFGFDGANSLNQQWSIDREARRHGIPRTPNFADFSSTGAARLPHLPASGVGLVEGNQVCVVHRPRSQATRYTKNAQFRRFLEYWGGQVTTSAGFRSWLGRRESGMCGS